MNKELKKKIDISIKVILVIIIILLLIHNCSLMKKNNQKQDPNGNIDIIEIECEHNQCKPVVTPTPNKNIKIESLAFTEKNISIKKGSSLGLIVVIKPSELSSSKLTWKSSNPKVVEIDANGKIKGLAVGTAVITVTSSNGISTTCVVNVAEDEVKAQKINLNTNKMTINVGDTDQIIATIEPSNATERELVWTSSDGNIVTVDNNGVIKGLKKGTATITVKTKDGKVVATCEVNVNTVDVKEIKLNHDKMTIKVGSSSLIKATIEPENATNKEITWISSDGKIATIGNDGVVNGVKPGTVTITAISKDGKAVAKCVVTVEAIPVEEIIINPTKLNLKVGKSSLIEAIVKPGNATDKELVWSSSDSSIATIDSNGIVKGIKPGKVTITIKTKDGKVVSTCIVTIEPIEVEKITLNPSEMSLTIGKSSQIVSVIKPSNATNKELVWSSSDSSIATVDKNGKVTGIKEGQVTITAKTKDGKVVATSIVNVVTDKVDIQNIKLNTNNVSIKIGSTDQLIATIEPANATERDLVWSSSDSSIVTVDSNGKITGVKVGKATITVTSKDGKVKTTCVVNVESIPVEEIILNPNELTVKVGKSEIITAVVEPDNATDKELIWTSSDITTAIVDNNGKVTGLKEGQVTITAKTKDGKVKAECIVTVEVDLIPNEVNVYDEEKTPVTWNGATDLKIFSKSIYDFDDVIAPESYNTYQFVVKNNTIYKIKYTVKFIETNLYNINMKYKLKKNNDYIYNTYSKASDLVIEDYILNAGENDTFYLDWKWISSSNDTNIGTNPEAKYGLRIEVEAESINE